MQLDQFLKELFTPGKVTVVIAINDAPLEQLALALKQEGCEIHRLKHTPQVAADQAASLLLHAVTKSATVVLIGALPDALDSIHKVTMEAISRATSSIQQLWVAERVLVMHSRETIQVWKDPLANHRWISIPKNLYS